MRNWKLKSENWKLKPENWIEMKMKWEKFLESCMQKGAEGKMKQNPNIFLYVYL